MSAIYATGKNCDESFDSRMSPISSSLGRSVTMARSIGILNVPLLPSRLQGVKDVFEEAVRVSDGGCSVVLVNFRAHGRPLMSPLY